MLKGFIYPLRASLVLAFLLWQLINTCRWIINNDLMLNLVCQIDIFHALFYASFPTLLLVTLFPSRIEGSRPRAALMAVYLVAGPLAGMLTCIAPLTTRPDLHIGGLKIGIAVWIAVNLTGLGWFHLGEKWGPRSRKWMRACLPLSDLFFPALVWSAYIYRETRGRRTLSVARILPAVLLALAPLLPWLVNPLDFASPLQFSAPLRLLDCGRYYQFLLDPQRRDLLVVDRSLQVIQRIDPLDGSRRERVALDIVAPIRALALDQESRSLVLVDPGGMQTQVLDADTLKLRRRIAFSGLDPASVESSQNMDACRTYWHAQDHLLYANCEGGLLLMCPDGRRPVAQYMGLPGDMLYDSERREFYTAAWNRALMALSPADLHPLREFNRGSAAPERMALDSRSGRLFVAYPMLSSVLVLDIESFTPIRWLYAFPGVRLVAIEPHHGWLLLAGLSPLIEVRSLQDLSLIRRIKAPPYGRWIEFDEQRDVAYLTSKTHGLWELDLKQLGQISSGARLLQRLDPFYLLTARLNLPILRALEMPLGGKSQAMQPAESFGGQPCGSGDWTQGTTSPASGSNN
ncbi:MAG: hypothetical protein P9M14_11685 [Candidatus Alcyoniella australis]|nr:hypothetical protein [Candidatus Alcyoniella australis]